MDFNDFMKEFTKNADRIFKENKNLFAVDIDKEEIWDKYLESFPSEKNKMYRTRREFDCSECKHFIRSFANVVAIQDNKVVTFWDFHTNDDTFEPVLLAMSEYVRSLAVADVFVTKQNSFGVEKTREILENKLVTTWNHFFVDVPKKMISTSSLSVNEISSSLRDIRNVFERSLEEITVVSVETVLDLISEKILYRGEEWKSNLEKFLSLKKNYSKLKKVSEKKNYCWSVSMDVGGVIGKIRNHSIGTLLLDISNGMEIDEAVRRYESILAPENYKRPKAIFTAKMVSNAQEAIVSMGLEKSLGRRHSKISDIGINNVLWADRKAKKKMLEISDSIFEELKEEISVNPNVFKNVQGISIDNFMAEIGTVKKLEILFENKHQSNLMSLISPIEKDSPSLFKWDNSFSWSYRGNIADSGMKERVKSAGGSVDGVLRFSLQWNTEKDNPNDFDAHCFEPDGNEIFFRNRAMVHSSSGVLDVDIINPGTQPAVENITWSNSNRMKVGKYILFVHNYSNRGGSSGFEAEIEFDGQIYEFSYPKNIKQGEKVVVAEVYFDADGNFEIMNSLHSSTKTNSKTIWNLKTNQFVPISVFMLSPNYWDGQIGVGNKHYFFISPNCINEDTPNGFYNEYLKEDFMKHRKVFEALGSKMKVSDSESQLSGLGFSSTKQDYIIVRIDGKTIKKIIF